MPPFLRQGLLSVVPRFGPHDVRFCAATTVTALELAYLATIAAVSVVSRSKTVESRSLGAS
jgi:hypothetical protein